MGAAWYLTKAGRADFAKKCRERDEKEREWWKDAALWVGIEDENHDPTMVAAVNNVIDQCPNVRAVMDDYARTKLERRDGFTLLKETVEHHEIERMFTRFSLRKQRDDLQINLQLTAAL